MDRIHEVATIINQKNITSILDVGCRDTVLKKHLHHGIQYDGNDLFQNKENTVKYVGDILALDIPNERYECVTALDILEHTDDPYVIFDKLSNITTKYLIINLPNCYDLKSISKFVFKGHLGGKYKFDVTNQLDRHRWLMNYNEIVNFYRYKAIEHNCMLEIIPLRYGGDNLTLTALAGKIINKLLPQKLSTASVIGIFEKK